MALFQNPSVTAQGKNEEFLLQLARGHISNHSFNHKFGAVPAMSNGTTGTVWDVNDTIYPWSTWDTAGTVSVATVNASDNGKQITIQGLDADYNFQEETIIMSSSGAVAGTKTFKRLNRGFIADGSTNVAEVTVTKSGTTVLKITAAKGQTLMAVYTVPANKTAYLLQGVCSIQKAGDATGDMFIRYFGQSSFRVGHSFEVQGEGGPYNYKFSVPIRIPEKSDIDVRAAVRTNNSRVTAAFDLILIDN
jgi:hypothetical protein